jgi:hypothetical protein
LHTKSHNGDRFGRNVTLLRSRRLPVVESLRQQAEGQFRCGRWARIAGASPPRDFDAEDYRTEGTKVVNT